MAVWKGLMIPVALCTFMLGIGGALGQGSEQERAACRRDVKRFCQAELQRNPDDMLSTAMRSQAMVNESRYARASGIVPVEQPLHSPPGRRDLRRRSVPKHGVFLAW
jgi:hypothetical protein